MRRNPIVSLFVRWFLHGLHGALWVCAITSIVLAFYILSPFGSRDRETAREQVLEDISIESQVFCEKFGMPVGTKQHRQCVLELQKIRENEDQRTGLVEDLL